MATIQNGHISPHTNFNHFQSPHSATDMINVLPGNSSVNMVQHATTEEAVFSVDQIGVPIEWLDSDHVICTYCRPMSVLRLYNESCEL
jgi:hypothetical protein